MLNLKDIIIQEEYIRNRDLQDLEKFFKHLDLNKELEKNQNVLEIGCGNGNTLSTIKETYQVNAFGLDLENFIEPKNKKKINFYSGDAENLPFENDTFDFIYSYYTFYLIPDKLKAIKEVHRILKPNKKALINLNFEKKEFIQELMFPPFWEILKKFPNEDQIKPIIYENKYTEYTYSIILEKKSKELNFPELQKFYLIEELSNAIDSYYNY